MRGVVRSAVARPAPVVVVAVAVVVVAVGIVATACGATPASADPALASVHHIVDGDTIDVTIDGHEQRVRLIGIDTPEIAHAPSGDRPGNDAECFADQAHAFVAALLPVGAAVRLERDVVGRDDYGRLLAYVYRASDGLFVNHEIVRRGYAVPLTIAPNVALHELMVDGAREAERADVGLWGACR